MKFSYHDIVALHLCLLIGQFVILHLKTKMTDNGFFLCGTINHYFISLEVNNQILALIYSTE